MFFSVSSTRCVAPGTTVLKEVDTFSEAGSSITEFPFSTFSLFDTKQLFADIETSNRAMTTSMLLLFKVIIFVRSHPFREKIMQTPDPIVLLSDPDSFNIAISSTRTGIFPSSFLALDN